MTEADALLASLMPPRPSHHPAAHTKQAEPRDVSSAGTTPRMASSVATTPRMDANLQAGIVAREADKVLRGSMHRNVTVLPRAPYQRLPETASYVDDDSTPRMRFSELSPRDGSTPPVRPPLEDLARSEKLSVARMRQALGTSGTLAEEDGTSTTTGGQETPRMAVAAHVAKQRLQVPVAMPLCMSLRC